MRKYQEPQMNILELEQEDIITSSTDGGLYEPDTGAGGSGTGGTDSGNWNDFWN